MPDIFFPGQLIRIKDFQFEDGGTRDKYLFVLLLNDKDAYVINTLTTTQNKMGVNANKIGCYFDPKVSTYFHFPAETPIGEGDFYFDKETYIFFFNNVHKVQIADLARYQSNDDPFSMISIAQLSQENLKNLLNCVINSIHTPNNLKSELKAFVEKMNEA